MRFWINLLIYAVLTLAISGLLLLLVVPISFEQRAAVVLSGSMEPALPTGSLAFSVPIKPEEVEVGDIIVFSAKEGSDITASHRVVEISSNAEGLSFLTKGDASENVDPFLIPADYVRGKVVYHIPRLGKMITSAHGYVRTWPGLVLLVGLPSLVIVGTTVRDVKRSHNRRDKRLDLVQKRKQRRRR